MEPYNQDPNRRIYWLNAMIMQFLGATTDEAVDYLWNAFGYNEQAYQEPEWIREALRPKNPHEAAQNYLDTRNTDRRWQR